MTNRDWMRMHRRAPSLVLAIGAAAVLAAGSAEAVTSKTWKQRDRSDFEMGEPKGVSLSADGPVRLGARLEALDAGDAPYIWAVAAGPKGSIYAAGGNDGSILRFEPGAERGAPFFRASEPEVQALAVDAAGAVYAGTSPGGRIYKITPEGKQVWVCDTGEKYVWSLLFDRQGGLIAATGNEGRVLRLDATGHSRVLFDTAETHVRSLALDAQGRLLAGTDGHGLVFRIGEDGKGVVLYDAPMPEVAALAAAADGTIYAAVVGEAGRSPRPSPQRPPQPTPPTDSGEPPPAASSSQGSSDSSSQQSPLDSRPPLSMDGKVLAIAADGYAREVWSGSQEAILSLALTRRGGLLMGDSKDGRIFQLEPGGGVSEIARSDASQVTALLRRPGGGEREDEVIVAGSNMGKVAILKPGFAASGTLTSRVFDAQSFATWGRIAWRADQPAGTSVALQVRSGNTEEPDRTWSEWGAELREPDGAPAGAPAARFVQWRASLATKDPGRTPEVREVALVYLPKNLPPEFRKVEVQAVGVSFQKVPAASAAAPPEGKPAGGETDPASRRRGRPQSRKGFEPGARSITWQVVDPNDDDVTVDVQYRALDEKNWKTVRKSIDEDFVTFDGATLPDGTYLVRLVASDAASNPAGQALTAEKISAPFDVDNTPPRIDRFKPVVSKESLHVTFAASDSFSVVREAAYSVDAGDWVPAPPSDGLSDSLQESYDLSLPSPPPGEHSIVVRAIDAAGNVGSGRAVVEVP